MKLRFDRVIAMVCLSCLQSLAVSLRLCMLLFVVTFTITCHILTDKSTSRGILKRLDQMTLKNFNDFLLQFMKF